jgi:DNA-binding MarR family transcriptional regulator
VSSAKDRLGYLLKHAFTGLAELMESALASLSISGRELAVLRVIAEDGPLSQQDVVRELNVDRTTMVAMIDSFEDRGLVRRTPHPADRRKNVVELTAPGRKVLAAATPLVDEAERRFLAALSEADVRRLKQLLRVLVVGERPKV